MCWSHLGLGVQAPLTSLGKMVGYGTGVPAIRSLDPAGACHEHRSHHTFYFLGWRLGP